VEGFFLKKFQNFDGYCDVAQAFSFE